jgi:transcriptional antiterminator RfaH
MDTMQRRWYALKVKPRQDDLAHRHLLNQDYEIYRPMVARARPRRQKMLIREESLFPGYMFIRLSRAEDNNWEDVIGDNWSPIRSTYGVDKFVRFGLEEYPPYIPNEKIAQLRALEAELANRVYQKDHFQPGDKVVVTEGIYHGLEAVFHCYDGEQRSIILLDFLNKITKLPVSPAILRAAA